ncbi:MAG: T9SS type A sorting domain-containing protein [Dysgonamonadaceae bacterium]|jgi:hypothetical protein|nr:T9SS type A sorting domain-containing protein [Dysgonamonadaceae bacterium]
MKKIYLLLIFALTVSVSFAQVKSSHLTSKGLNNSVSNTVSKNDLNLQKAEIQQVKATLSDDEVVVTSFNSVQEAIQALQNAPQAAPTAQYLRPDGTLFNSFTRDYKAYSNVLFMYAPAQVTLDFEPYSDTQSAVFSWVLPTSSGDKPLTGETDANGVLHWFNDIIPAGYYYNIPIVKATAAGGSSTYQLGQGVTYRVMYAGNVERDEPAEDGTFLGDLEEYPPLTLANMHMNRPASGNLYSGFTGAGGFSSTFIHPQYGACTGIMQILPQMASPLYAESVSVLAFTDGTAVPAGGNLKIQFFYLTEDGEFGDLIAESTTNEFIETYNSQGAFIFTFQVEEDGFIIDKPLVLGTQAPVAVVLSGFDSTWDFTVLMGVNGSLPGSSYTLHGDKVATFGFSNEPNTPRADLYIQFNGIFNCLALYDEDLTEVVFPIEGGWGITAQEGTVAYNDIDIVSSFDVDDVWIEDMPSWIVDYEFDNEYFEDYNVIMLYAKASALPAGVSGRKGNIVVGSYGVTLSIPVIQGDGGLGISSSKVEPTSVSRSGNDFILKYPATATSVEVYNIAGQKVGDHKLNASGTYTLSAAGLANGVYILKINGSNEVVKILK